MSTQTSSPLPVYRCFVDGEYIEYEPAFPPGLPGLTSYMGRSQAASLASEGDIITDDACDRDALRARARKQEQRARAAFHTEYHATTPARRCICGCGGVLPPPTRRNTGRPLAVFLQGHNARQTPARDDRGVYVGRTNRKRPDQTPYRYDSNRARAVANYQSLLFTETQVSA